MPNREYRTLGDVIGEEGLELEIKAEAIKTYERAEQEWNAKHQEDSKHGESDSSIYIENMEAKEMFQMREVNNFLDNSRR